METSLRYTTTDLEGLPAIDGVRYEIIDGELFVCKQPDWRHQCVCGEIFAALRAWSRATGAGVAIEAPGVIFAPEDHVAPDLVWISGARFASLWDERGHLRAAPDLIVEVVAPGAENERRDRDLKLKLYSRQGLREYWIADWQRRVIQVYRREQTAPGLVATVGDEDVLTSPLLPGFACPVADLWEPPRQ